MSKKKRKQKAETQVDPKIFAAMLAMNEESMGDGAAYLVTCEQLGVDPDDGYDLLMDA